MFYPFKYFNRVSRKTISVVDRAEKELGSPADWVRIAASLAAATLLIGSFRFIAWPRPSWQTTFLTILPLPEILIILGCLLATNNGRSKGAVAIPLSLYLGILTAWNGGELFYRWNYREHFALFDDIGLLPSLVSMVSRLDWFRTPWGIITTYTLSLMLIMILGGSLYRIFSRAGRILYRRMESRGTARGFSRSTVGAVIVGIAVLQAAVFPTETPTLLLAGSIIARIRPAAPPRTAETPVLPAPTREEIAEARSAFVTIESRIEHAYPGIADSDIHLFIVESYGHTLFTNPIHRSNISDTYRRTSENLEVRGWSAVSGFLHSPAYGGRSWLADSTLLTGRRMSNQRQYDEHIYTGEPNIVGQMGAAGYQTVYAAPGMRRAPREWRDFYGFDEYLIEGDMGWNGPSISFGEMSDQYLLDFVGRRYVEDEHPLFLAVLMVSSHVPFVFIPEIVEDWDLLGDGSIYRSEGIRRFDNNWLGGSEYPEGYVFSIDYALRSIVGYLDRYVDDDALVVIVGDHQPRTPISENSATYGVPIHFLSRNAAVLEPLETEGFSPGFRPEDESPLIPMEDFPTLLNMILQPRGALENYLP